MALKLYLVFARIFSGRKVALFAIRALNRILNFFLLVASVTDRISPAAIWAFEFIGVNGQVIRLEEIVFAL